MSSEIAPKKTLNAVVKQIGSWTAISRVAGFVRDLVFAHFLGQGLQQMRFWWPLNCLIYFGDLQQKAH